LPYLKKKYLLDELRRRNYNVLDELLALLKPDKDSNVDELTTKEKLDANLTLLQFCYPKLRAIELTDIDGENIITTFGALVKELAKK